MDLIGRLWERSPLYLTRDEFEQTLVGWEIEPVEADGAVVGVFLTQGPELHFDKWEPAYQPTREVIRAHLAPLIERHGYAFTRTPKDDTRMLRFNLRTGWRQVGEDEFDIHLRLDQLRF